MNTNEIQALVDETKDNLAAFDPPLNPTAMPYRWIAAIETLLAREAEVLDRIWTSSEVLYNDCYAILNPTETPK